MIHGATPINISIRGLIILTAMTFGPLDPIPSRKPTTLETGSNVRRGFTLIELIIVIALVALIGGLVTINAGAILRGLGEEPVDRILKKAVREARFQAASIKEPAYLRYDKESGEFLVSTGAGAQLASFDVTPEDEEVKPEVEFEQILPSEGLDSPRMETVSIQKVVFRADRSSTPFQATIQEGTSSFTLRYDPFSAIVTDDSRNP